jgi:glycosyltransferase involved in cell wall biosynthesis
MTVMLSVLIATKNSERQLLPTLAALIPGALAGLVREVIVADAHSEDSTALIADAAGCRFVTSSEPRAKQLDGCARSARGPWLLFIQPGVVPQSNWFEEVSRFIEDVELGKAADASVGVFRTAPGAGTRRSMATEAFVLLGTALGLVPRSIRGFIVSKQLYDELGGLRSDLDPERDLLRRIGRRRLVTLRGGASYVA